MILGISGFSGTGKDIAADFLVKNHGFTKVALADPLKRVCKDVFDFSEEQLWGSSEKRNEPDKRYPRLHTWEGPGIKCFCCGDSIRDESQCYLTPRYALQLLGTEWGRACYPDIWVEYGLRVAKDLLEYGEDFGYFPATGVFPRPRSSFGGNPHKGVVIPDVRFKNEIAAIKKAGGKVVRIKRTGYEKPTWDHPSELEQTEVPDEEFDYILLNSGTISDLTGAVDTMVATRNLHP